MCSAYCDGRQRNLPQLPRCTHPAGERREQASASQVYPSLRVREESRSSYHYGYRYSWEITCKGSRCKWNCFETHVSFLVAWYKFPRNFQKTSHMCQLPCTIHFSFFVAHNSPVTITGTQSCWTRRRVLPLHLLHMGGVYTSFSHWFQACHMTCSRQQQRSRYSL